MQPVIEIYQNPDDLFHAARDHVIQACHTSVRERDRFTLALSGGKTPIPLYRSLADPDVISDWQQIHLFMVDERFVPYDHPDSNWGMIRRVLLDRIQIPDENCHPVRIYESARASAETYSLDLLRSFQDESTPIPSLDFMILGLGTDGHTASLFPGTPALHVTDTPAVDVYPAHARHPRISLTFPVIHHARQRLFIVLGKSKAVCVRDVIVRKSTVPATMACQGTGDTFFLLDTGAAAELEGANVI